jgi:hypothetical protein
MKWVGHAARRREKEMNIWFRWKNTLKYLHIAVRITLEWVFKKLNWGLWTKFTLLWKGTVALQIIIL